MARVVKALDMVHEKLSDYKVKIALEITAGQGSALGSDFDEIGQIIESAQESERLVVCFDTCHALAAGYEFRDVTSYKKMIDDFDSVIGLDRLKVIHVNDSVQDVGSHVDRHAHIGEGCIGLEPFGYFLNDSRFKKVPFLLETPKDDGPVDDERNLEKLKGLIEA